MKPDDDPVMAEVQRLHLEIEERQEQVRALLKLREYPTVIPVQVYHRHCREYREPYDWGGREEGDALREAYVSLRWSGRRGRCSAVGVEVGGVLHTMAELEEQFGDPADERRGLQ